jgi:hypothetical protein
MIIKHLKTGVQSNPEILCISNIPHKPSKNQSQLVSVSMSTEPDGFNIQRQTVNHFTDINI